MAWMLMHTAIVKDFQADVLTVQMTIETIVTGSERGSANQLSSDIITV